MFSFDCRDRGHLPAGQRLRPLRLVPLDEAPADAKPRAESFEDRQAGEESTAASR